MDLRLPRIKILLLEDDALFGASLEEFLDEEEFSVTWVQTVDAAIEATFGHEYALYILDINLPDGDGKQLLQELRQSSDNTPALFLTSYKDKQTLQEGFNSGADDFLTKPVDLDELLLRLHAILKRSGKLVDEITFSNGVVFDLNHCRLLHEGNDLKVTVKALQLLKLFIQKRSQVISKEQIQDAIWGEEEFSEGSLRVYINRLKKILPQHSIINIKGVGYRFELQ
ncbi:MAG: response regulator transcription factor [Campylobacterota bacterium]